MAAQTFWRREAVKRHGDHYEADVAMDRYPSTGCGYYLFAIGFWLRDQAGRSTGFFSSTPQLTKHVDGPVPMVWNVTPGKGDPQLVGGASAGLVTLTTTNMTCRPISEHGVGALFCDFSTNADRHSTFITEGAKEAIVNLNYKE